MSQLGDSRPHVAIKNMAIETEVARGVAMPH